MPVAPDLAKMVKVKSDHSENLAKVLCGAKNGKFIQISPIFSKTCLKLISFDLIFIEKCLLYGAKSPTYPICQFFISKKSVDKSGFVDKSGVDKSEDALYCPHS